MSNKYHVAYVRKDLGVTGEGKIINEGKIDEVVVNSGEDYVALELITGKVVKFPLHRSGTKIKGYKVLPSKGAIVYIRKEGKDIQWKYEPLWVSDIGKTVNPKGIDIENNEIVDRKGARYKLANWVQKDKELLRSLEGEQEFLQAKIFNSMVVEIGMNYNM